ncbi:hypothetical protein [Arenibaculum pallidiluteum]|uniref:hypothetical protein n=1 Tax=Arenibaculum pallidiluteum TaxID=2812559 RepID=UPI001A971D47|nr:hypothetical protein [Arenibaculum pallidiluteum]
MKTIVHALSIALILSAGAAAADEGTPNPMFPGVDWDRSAITLSTGAAQGDLAKIDLPQPSAGRTAVDAVPAYDAPAYRAERMPAQNNFNDSVSGAFSRQ